MSLHEFTFQTELTFTLIACNVSYTVVIASDEVNFNKEDFCSNFSIYFEIECLRCYLAVQKKDSKIIFSFVKAQNTN